MILISKIKTSEALTNLRFELEVRFVRRKNRRFVSVDLYLRYKKENQRFVKATTC